MCMFKQAWSCSFLSTLVILLLTTCLENASSLATQKGLNNSIPSLIIFGDSTVDPGNNNYLRTIFKSDFSPYGIDFSDQTPTGRFTNGRLVTDFIASYLGLTHSVPAYLDPRVNMKDLVTSVSFASAGSGYDPFTSDRVSVISMSKQLEYFDEYKKRLQQMIGKKKMEKIVENGVYIISAGTNDIVYNFGVVDSPLLKLIAPSYLRFLLNQCIHFLQALKDRGARKIGIVGLPPAGCLPGIITLHSSLNEPRRCVDSVSSIARDYNQLLQAELNAIQASQPNYLVVYGDIYGPLYDQFNHPQKYGFEVINKGCCGTGSLELGLLCNSLAQICSNRSIYMFWDAIHPTERSYYFLFQSLRPLVDLLLHH